MFCRQSAEQEAIVANSLFAMCYTLNFEQRVLYLIYHVYGCAKLCRSASLHRPVWMDPPLGNRCLGVMNPAHGLKTSFISAYVYMYLDIQVPPFFAFLC